MILEHIINDLEDKLDPEWIHPGVGKEDVVWDEDGNSWPKRWYHCDCDGFGHDIPAHMWPIWVISEAKVMECEFCMKKYLPSWRMMHVVGH